jgi:hypothetical protein
VIGRTYHRRYGYPWRWAILAELAWRFEHLPLGRLAVGRLSLAQAVRAHRQWCVIDVRKFLTSLPRRVVNCGISAVGSEAQS